MKLKRVHIKNFKGIKEVEIDFMGPSGPRWMTALLGDNGSGKTTVLQAIAFVLSKVIGQGFHWPGFDYDRISTRGNTRVDLEVLYSREEFSLVTKMLDDLNIALPARLNGILTSRTSVESQSLTFTFEHEKPRHKDQDSPPYFTGETQTRDLVNILNANSQLEPKRGAHHDGVFSTFGQVYWFTQLRNVGSVNSGPIETKEIGLFSGNWRSSVQELREVLIAWWGVEKTDQNSKPNSKLRRLEGLLGKLFPETKFAGMSEKLSLAATPLISDYYFELERDGNRYDISEMSSGEQAIFPLLFEFVRLDIEESSSLVLIDELELHLHPPEQQALFRALPLIGPDCQYIITTHSEVLTDVIPNEWEVRLHEGRVG